MIQTLPVTKTITYQTLDVAAYLDTPATARELAELTHYSRQYILRELRKLEADGVLRLLYTKRPGRKQEYLWERV